MGEITGGELILKHLAQEKVSHIFGVPDFAYNPILGKLDKYGIRFVTPRHEASAGSARLYHELKMLNKTSFCLMIDGGLDYR